MMDERLSDLIHQLSQEAVFDRLLSHLELTGVIEVDIWDLLNREYLNRNKIMRLLEILKWKGQECWSELIEFITKQGFSLWLADLDTWNNTGKTILYRSDSGTGNTPVGAIAEQTRLRNAVLKSNVGGLCAVVDADLMIRYVRMKGLMTGPTAAKVNRQKSDASKILFLFDRMASTPEFFDVVIEFLHQTGYTRLRVKLLADLKHLA